MSEDEDDVVHYATGDLMQDPEDYYPPTPPPTRQVFEMQSGKQVTLHLVGHSPTEAHHVWNGARLVSEYFERAPSRVRGRSLLELGAGAGLPSLVAGILGAKKVVATDFPDPDIVANMQRNIDECDETVEPRGRIGRTVDAVGFVWGADPGPLLARLAPDHPGHPDRAARIRIRAVADEEGLLSSPPPPPSSTPPGQEGTQQQQQQQRFDVLVLADLLFRHSEHGALVKTIGETMRRSRESAAYVFFTSYRPWKQDLDMNFFDVARRAGLEVAQVEERKLDKPLFEGDPGDLDVQRTVKGFELRWRPRDCTEP